MKLNKIFLGALLQMVIQYKGELQNCRINKVLFMQKLFLTK